MMNHKKVFGLTAALLITGATQVLAGTSGWRIDGTGVVEDATPVTEWSTTKNVVWSTELNDWSNATPLLIGDKLIVCEEKSTVVCVDATSGKILWRQAIEITLPEGKENPPVHDVNGYSSPSPITDGKNIYVAFSFGTTAALDLDGNILWSKYLSTPKNKWGFCATPVLADNKLMIHIGPTLHALDATTGKELWKVEAESKWGTDIHVKVGDANALYTTGGDLINVKDGSFIAKKIAKLPWSSPIVDNGIVYIVDEREAYAVKLPETITAKAEIIWKTKFKQPIRNRFYSSPILYNGLLYNVNRYSVLVTLDAQTGEIVYEKKLDLPKETLYPSPVMAGGKLFISHDTGKTLVIEPGKEYKQIAESTLEPFRSIPLFSGDKIYIRTLKKLYCIGKTSK